MVAAVERSIEPLAMTNVAPIAIRPITALAVSMLTRLTEVMKTGELNAKKMLIAARNKMHCSNDA